MRRPGSTAASLRWDFSVLIGFLLLVGVVRFVAFSVVTSGLGERMAAVDDALRANDTVLQSLTDAETGVRGYQLTGDPLFLQPYLTGVRDYPAAMDLALARAPSPGIRRLLLAERDAAQSWLDRFGGPVAGTPPGHPDRLAQDSTQGRVLFDRLRAANAAVVATLEKQRSDTLSRFRLANTVSQAILDAMSILSAVLALVIAVRIRRLLLRPLDRLLAALRRLGAGDSSARAPEEGPPELRTVIHTLNELVDDSVRRRAEEAQRSRLRVAALEVRSRVAQRLSWPAVLDEAGAAIGHALRADRVYLYVSGDDDTLPVAREWQGPGLVPVPLPAVPPAAGGTGPVARSDAEPDPTLPAGVAGYVSDVRARAYAFVPFGAGTTAAGGLVVTGCTAARTWAADEIAFLEGAAADLARALDRVRLDEQQEELVNRLRELNRRRSEFVNMVSHDLRGPLTSILGYVEDITEDEGHLTDQQRAGLRVILRNTSRLTGMADELLTLARAEAPGRPLDPRPIRVAELVSDVIAAVTPGAEEGGLTLRGDVPADLWIDGDRAQLERAVHNMVGNAVKFTPPGGLVEVSATERRTGGVQLSVRDTGIGIPEKERAGLFEPFRRARNATAAAIPGTGLGLAIVRAVVQQHGGTIALESNEGAGTVVTITLPARTAADQRDRPAALT